MIRERHESARARRASRNVPSWCIYPGSMISFVLDVHLAKLARHLRMLGFDSLWTSELNNDEILNFSRDEKRVILTRDRELYIRADERLRHYVQAIDPQEQLVEVLEKFGLFAHVQSGKGFLSRCLQCNAPIIPVTGNQIAHKVPAHVLEERSEFYFCPRCERAYWKGSHWGRMRQLVERLIAAKRAME